MKVLLLGATGNFGSRLLPALLSHNHTVVIYVRSASKLQDLFPASTLSECVIVTGDATDSTKIQKALIEHRCTAVVDSAGLAAVWPWQAPQMQDIVHAVSGAAVGASQELGWPIRGWFLGGIAVLDVPYLKGRRISEFFPLFWEHTLTHTHLLQLPPSNLAWSILAPSQMVPSPQQSPSPTSTTPSPSSNPRSQNLITAPDTPPNWQQTFWTRLPLIPVAVSTFLDIVYNAMRYTTTLEDCAEFVAGDLEAGMESGVVGRRVGVMMGKGRGD